MTKYKTKCPHCDREFTIRTAKTRYSKFLRCNECGQESHFSMVPEKGKIILLGYK